MFRPEGIIPESPTHTIGRRRLEELMKPKVEQDEVEQQ